MAFKSHQWHFKTFGVIERAAAFAQGKGFGAGTIKREVKLACRLLNSDPDLAIDIGGNIGNYTAELRLRNPGLEIHTFEPSATNVERLKCRFRDDGRIAVIPLALSDSTGPATLYSDQPGSGLGSLSARRLDHLSIHFVKEEVISTIRFEEYWKTVLKSRRLDIVKLDIEGHELAALNGFGDALRAANVLQFEFGGCNIDTRIYFQDFWYFFKDQGFVLFRIAPFGLEKLSRYTERDEYFCTTNYIAVNQYPRELRVGSAERGSFA